MTSVTAVAAAPLQSPHVRISVFTGDITAATADAICTSTNPRLSLMMGTGGAVREAGGWDVLRACEEIVADSRRRGRPSLLPGSVHVTTAGTLPFRCVIHCVASDDAHHSSPAVVRVCVRNALSAADARGLRSVAMPLFATGHAHVGVTSAIGAMLQELQASTSAVEEVIVVVRDEDTSRQVRLSLGQT